jgi:predicted DNA-binding protein with PD1-like motif
MSESNRYLDGTGTGRVERIVMGKFKIGVDLLDGILELTRKENIKTGVLLSGVGALGRAVFRNAKSIPSDYKMQNSNRVFLDIETPLELLSLSGWIATTETGETNVHAHFMTTTVMDNRAVGLGGHLVKGTITSIKVVVVIGVIEDSNIKAALDPVLNQVNVCFNSLGSLGKRRNISGAR